MQLSFITFDSNVEFTVYDVPMEIENEISDALSLDRTKRFIISFSRFVDFDKTYHGKAIEYFLNHISNNLERKVVSEDELNFQVTYSFKNADNVTKTLDIEQLKFLCAVFHHLDLKKYLVALSVLLIKDLIKFDDLKVFCKDDRFGINIFVDK